MPSRQPPILPPDAHGIAQAAEALKRGALVGLPTETVYGLAADARNGRAVARIFEAKGRPRFNPLIVHVADRTAAEDLAAFGPETRDLARAFWPGPLTLVLPLKDGHGLSDLVRADLPTVAIRVPSHPVMQAVLRAFGAPVAAPSANPSGRISPTTAAHVARGLGDRLAGVVDGGPCEIGLESTILAPGPDGMRLLREGGLDRETIAAVAGPLVEDTTPGKVVAPGQLSSHYAPGTRLRIGLERAAPDAVTIGFGPGPGTDLTLSRTGDMVEAAARLFAVLHEADALAQTRGASHIAVASVPDLGLGRAINDRLRRAAAPAS